MRTQAINTTEKNNTNVIAAGVGGATAAALVSRYAPLTHNEHMDAFSKPVKSEIKTHVLDAKNQEFNAIVEEFAKNEALKKMGDTFKANKNAIIDGAEDKITDAIKDFDEVSKTTFKTYAKRVADTGNVVEAVLNHNVIKQAKKSRPAFYFAALAGAASMTLAVLKNVISAKKVQNETVTVNYDKEGMIIDAPDSLALAIILDEYA